LQLAAIQWPCFVPYGKCAVELYFSGCTHNCKECHNPELKNFRYGDPFNISETFDYLNKRKNLFSVISLTGGDPLCHKEKLKLLCELFKSYYFKKELWLFTGFELKDCPEEILRYCDYIKTGVYNENEKQEGFPSSRNQKLNKKGVDY
jgi:anaerobic ribonucleoside-triphosphate reductase activating protein